MQNGPIGVYAGAAAAHNLGLWRKRPTVIVGPGQAGLLPQGGDGMLWTIFVILLVLWLLGVVTSYTLGGFIHLLLVIALVVLLIQLITGRRPVL